MALQLDYLLLSLLSSPWSNFYSGIKEGWGACSSLFLHWMQNSLSESQHCTLALASKVYFLYFLSIFLLPGGPQLNLRTGIPKRPWELLECSKPCQSEYSLWVTNINISRKLVDMQTFRPNPRPTESAPACTFECKKHCSAAPARLGWSPLLPPMKHLSSSYLFSDSLPPSHFIYRWVGTHAYFEHHAFNLLSLYSLI